MFDRGLTSKLEYVTPLYAALLSVFAITGVTVHKSSLQETSLYIVFALLFWLFAALPPTRTKKASQVVLFATLGIAVTTLVTPKQIGGDLTCMIAVMLAYRYGFLERHAIWRTLAIMGTHIVARIGLYIFTDHLALNSLLNTLAIDASVAPVMYWIFEDEVIRNRRQRRELERLYAENAPFVQFGRNTSGIVHDFKNDLSLFSTFGQLLQLRVGEKIDRSLIEQFQGYVGRFERRIELLLFVSRASRLSNGKRWNVIRAVDSALYVFESNLAYKKLITFRHDHEVDEILCIRHVFHFTTILENLIRNSCEAIAGTQRQGRVVVGTKLVGETIEIRISDDGPGIPVCDECTKADCGDCVNLAQMETTKPDGTGLGLHNVRNAVEKLGGEFTIVSRTGEGVTNKISIPRCAEIADE